MKDFINKHPFLFAFIVLPTALYAAQVVARGWQPAEPPQPQPRAGGSIDWDLAPIAGLGSLTDDGGGPGYEGY